MKQKIYALHRNKRRFTATQSGGVFFIDVVPSVLNAQTLPGTDVPPPGDFAAFL